MDIKQWLLDVAVVITKHGDYTYIVSPTDKTPDKFYFGFTRDIIGFESQLHCELAQDNGAIVSFDNYDKLQDRDKETVNALDALVNP